jgi:nucleoside phosphorylase
MEYMAVRAHLGGVHEVVHPRGTVYEVGELPAKSGVTWDVVVAEIGAGNPVAGIETTRAIEFFRPRVAMFVGVAGGFKDVAVGDVVAADYVYGYESSKVAESLFARIKTFGSAYPLVQRARAVRRNDAWLERVTSGARPNAYVGPIASGEQVIADRDSDTYEMLKLHCGDALAIEMEGWGFLFGAHSNGDVPAIVVRGISDLIEGKSADEDIETQPRAAQHAAAFAMELLATLDLRHDIGALDAAAVDNLVMPSGDQFPTRAPTN